ncbi:MAG: hypothetical protein IKV75_05740 [Bacteroidales bacterium]|nr:hypothetical protein [Bacteroidales bacterium]
MTGWEIISLSAFITMLLGAFLIATGATKGGLCSMIIGVIMGIMAIVVKEHEETTPTALDVYRGKTTLEITYRDSVAVDSVVVYKMKQI